MHFVEKPGTSVEAMHRITVQASKELRAIPGVRNFGSHIGRAEVADEVVGPNFTELWISIDPDVDYAGDACSKIEEVVVRLPRPVPRRADLPARADQGGADRRRAPRSSCGCTARTWTCCGRRRRRSKRRWPTVPGVINLKVEPQVLVPQIEVRLRPEAAERFGLTAGPRPPGVDDAAQGREGRRGVRGAEEVRRGRLGRARTCGPTWRRSAALPIDTPAGRAGAARRRGRRGRSCRRRTRSSARTPRAGSTSPATSQGRDLGVGRPRDRSEGASSCRSTASTTPSSSASTRPGRNRRRRLYAAGRRWRWSASCCCCTSTSRPGGRRCSWR